MLAPPSRENPGSATEYEYYDGVETVIRSVCINPNRKSTLGGLTKTLQNFYQWDESLYILIQIENVQGSRLNFTV